MEVATIKASKRSEKGSNRVAAIRQEGRVPAVMYGGGGAVENLTLGERDLERHLRQHHRVYKVDVDGKTEPAYLQDVQWDCLTDRPLHVDLKRIDLNKPIQLNVEIVFLGHAAGLSQGGKFVRDTSEVGVSCLPAAIPEHIEVPIAHLEIGMKVVASDLKLPAGVTLDVPPDTGICHVTFETVTEEPEEAIEGEAAEGEAAAAPEGGAPADGDSGGGS